MTKVNQHSAIRGLVAIAAIATALSCRDSGPRVTILFPAESSHFAPGDTIDFSANLNSDIDFGVVPQSAWRWISDIDGELGTSPSISIPSLSVAEHQVTASVRHRLGLSRARVVVFVDSVPRANSTR